MTERIHNLFLPHSLRDIFNYTGSNAAFPFLFSTINPILYNVMSHRYRVAFRDTLCHRKRGYYSSTNGFVREQSSFRETTIAAAGRDQHLHYEGSQLVIARRRLRFPTLLILMLFIFKASNEINVEPLFALQG